MFLTGGSGQQTPERACVRAPPRRASAAVWSDGTACRPLTDSGTAVVLRFRLAGWLAGCARARARTHANTITGDFAYVKGLRNSNDNYLSNNVASNRVTSRRCRHGAAPPTRHFALYTLRYPLRGDVFVNNGCQSHCREQASSFLRVPRITTAGFSRPERDASAGSLTSPGAENAGGAGREAGGLPV